MPLVPSLTTSLILRLMTNNNEGNINQLHQRVREKLRKSLHETTDGLDEILEDLTVEELALISAKVNHQINLKLNS